MRFLAVRRLLFPDPLAVLGSRLYADMIVYRGSNPLLTAEVAFSGLNRNVPQEELNLL